MTASCTPIRLRAKVRGEPTAAISSRKRRRPALSCCAVAASSKRCWSISSCDPATQSEFAARFDNTDVYRMMYLTLFGKFLSPAYGRSAPTRP